jgi:ribonuclease H / adenosylcobalamin/alpha-ribazole phosphatase
MITDRRGRVLAEVGEGIGVATNNVAEYTAVLEGLRKAAELGATHVQVRSDSRLLVEQLSGRFRVKNATLIRLHGEVRQLASAFSQVTYEHVPRELNREADRLANQGVDRWLAGPGQDYVPAQPSPDLFE